MATYSPNGRGHRTLAALVHGPRLFDHLRDEACADGCAPSKKLKFKHLARALREDRLVLMEGWSYSITDEGRDVLERLDRGEDVTLSSGAPNVRVFASQGSHA